MEVGLGSRLIADITASYYEIYIRKYAKGKLIDIGCGKVPFYEAYKDYITDNICVDWENTSHKNDYLDYECDLTKKLPFDEGEFDTILVSDVLEHLSQPEFLWEEIARLLTTGGKILMSVPFYYCIHEAPHDYYRYTEYALHRFAASVGCEIIFISPLGGIPEIIADILAKQFQSIPILGKILATGIQHFTYAFVRTRFGKKMSEKTSIKFPIGYFLVAEKK